MESYFAQITGGVELEFVSEAMPNWFKVAAYDKF